MSGFQSTSDGKLHGELFVRHAGVDQLIGSADSGPAGKTDAGAAISPAIAADLMLPAAPARCGDFLIFKVTLTSGSSDYIELGTGLRIP